MVFVDKNFFLKWSQLNLSILSEANILQSKGAINVIYFQLKIL